MYQDHSNRIVAKTQIGDVRVSTMFIGIDQRYSDSDTPMLFETMIFGGAHNEEFWRCSTWSEAEAQHREACALVMV